ncbi:phosphoribosylformylglycinamidine synthase [Coemansia sp. RSA 2131]|nr:phosphoribosylformylglycinamidine synthase [Coemansia sp. RSA 2131]
MLVVPGRSQAVSGFRLKTLIEKFPFPSGAIASMQAHYAHFVEFDPSYSETSAVFSAAQTDHTPVAVEALQPTTAENVWTIIATLLRAPGETGAPHAPIQLLDETTDGDEAQDLAANERELWVLPRRGTISPWSSKATDIFGLCGLGCVVRRVERGVVYRITFAQGFAVPEFKLSEHRQIINAGSDRMTEGIYESCPAPAQIFAHAEPRPLREVPIRDSSDGELARPIRSIEAAQAEPSSVADDQGAAVALLVRANRELGLALASDEIAYLVDAYLAELKRNPTDTELMMFAQVNSEHCRHKIFNAAWTIDGHAQTRSLFDWIRATQNKNPEHVLSAYSDNAAVLEAVDANRIRAWAPLESDAQRWGMRDAGAVHIVAKVETHNHPTLISPFAGAATGAGGEIRDEGAVGLGSRPKCGLAGYAVSDLRIPGFEQPWEAATANVGFPAHVASALDIMLEAPLGAAAFANEFGRPAIMGFFRTYLQRVPTGMPPPQDAHVDEPDLDCELRGFHKPIMIAGGMGSVRAEHVLKTPFAPGARLIVLGGPSMLIGLGGGAASSVASGTQAQELDFASVQRGNPEMERRCQMVLDACTALGAANPIAFVHDVGAGGLSNALTELVHDSGLGADIEIRDVPCADAALSPMEIWCNESQERYVLAVTPEQLSIFEQIARRERCPFAVVGSAVAELRLRVTDRLMGGHVIDLPMDVLFGKPPKMTRDADSLLAPRVVFDASLTRYQPAAASLTDRVHDAVTRVLRLPSVASKSFLITIGDRSVTGLVARDPMVGPWQVPVADVAITCSGYESDLRTGEAMAMGERPTLAVIDSAAASRMAVAESLLNLAAAAVPDLSWTKLSANWMAAASHAGEGARLYGAVRALSELCQTLGISVPVGKDSMSMQVRWEDTVVTAPVALVVTAFSAVRDTRATLTPQLQSQPSSVLLFADLAPGKRRLGGSALAQVYSRTGAHAPDVEDPQALRSFFNAVQHLRPHILAYHDRSDGGLFVTLAEMAFAGHVGVDVDISPLLPSGTSTEHDIVATLFNEELGAVLQVSSDSAADVIAEFALVGVSVKQIGSVGCTNQDGTDAIKINVGSSSVFAAPRSELWAMWAETSFRMQEMRDHPECAAEEFSLLQTDADRGLKYALTYDPSEMAQLIPQSPSAIRPRVAVLREQGVNSHAEMAYAFHQAGFDAVDVHMTDIFADRVQLDGFTGLAAVGGFSYGDVLGAGAGWAKSILLSPLARAQFTAFFERQDTFALGVCNGCQMLSNLRDLIPGAADWPYFVGNESSSYEGRVVMVQPTAEASQASVFFENMVGSQLPIVVAHGEGRARFASDEARQRFVDQQLAAVKYVDRRDYSIKDERIPYPMNPNGADLNLAAVVTPNGRVLAIMPHPERVVRTEANSYVPKDGLESWEHGPWARLFINARRWVFRTSGI